MSYQLWGGCRKPELIILKPPDTAYYSIVSKAIFKIISGICASLAHRRFLFEYTRFVKDKYIIYILHISQNLN